MVLATTSNHAVEKTVWESSGFTGLLKHGKLIYTEI
jgi:hypothetical protein